MIKKFVNISSKLSVFLKELLDTLFENKITNWVLIVDQEINVNTSENLCDHNTGLLTSATSDTSELIILAYAVKILLEKKEINSSGQTNGLFLELLTGIIENEEISAKYIIHNKYIQ